MSRKRDRWKPYPLCVGVRASIRQAGRISFPIVYRAANTKGERRAIRGAMRSLRNTYPDRWTDHQMTHSLLKRLRNVEIGTAHD